MHDNVAEVSKAKVLPLLLPLRWPQKRNW